MKKTTYIILCLIILLMTYACKNEKEKTDVQTEIANAITEVQKLNIEFLNDSISVFNERMQNLEPIEIKKVILDCESSVRANGKKLISQHFDPIFEKYDEKEIFKAIKNIFLIKCKEFKSPEEEKQFDNVYSSKGGFYMTLEEGIVEEYYKALETL